MKTIPRPSRGFTIVEVMLAVMMFGLIIIGIYSVWSVIVQGSKAGLSAAAVAQRAVTEAFIVGDSKKGTRPIRFAVRIKRKRVPKKAR